MTVEDRIARGQRVRLLLEDEVVAGVFNDLDARGQMAFKSATSDDDRRNVWALVNAMDELKRQLRIIVEEGEVALAERERAEKRAVQQRGTGGA